jgi:hypothetical protein
MKDSKMNLLPFIGTILFLGGNLVLLSFMRNAKRMSD